MNANVKRMLLISAGWDQSGSLWIAPKKDDAGRELLSLDEAWSAYRLEMIKERHQLRQRVLAGNDAK
jgi:hypothetical protein